MIYHQTYSSSARLFASLAIALAFALLIAGSAATPAKAGSSQWMFAQPHSWGHSNGWRMQRRGTQQGAMQQGGMQRGNMQQWGMQNWGQPHFDGNGARQFDMGDSGQLGMDGNGARQFGMGNFGQFGMGDFHHDGGDSHHDGNHHDDFFDDHHDHFHNGFVIVSPGFFNPFANPFFFNPGFAGAPVFVSPGFTPGFTPSFVTPPFNVQQTPFIVLQPGFSAGQPFVGGQSFVGGQPFVTGQPQFFLDPRSASGTIGLVGTHSSLGQSSWWHRTDNGWRRSPTMSSHVTVIRPGTPMASTPTTSGNVTVIRPGMN